MIYKKIILSIIIVSSSILVLAIYYFRIDLSILYHRLNQESTTAHIKNESIFKRYPRFLYGIDLSHYQGKIDWKTVNYINDSIPIAFIIVRATMGIDGLDSEYISRWETIKSKGIIRGAYHYYRPNQHSLSQAKQFKNRVKLRPGDLPPILDIENLSTIQTVENLKLGIKKWLDDIEFHYGVTPIIYTGDHFYRKHLNTQEFDKYPIWIANYGNYYEPFTKPWNIWQFTEQGQIEGVEGFIDLNVYNGTYPDLKSFLIQ
ncbi:GH25 family lysozyme [Formosa algae]|uniref:Lysozyme n=1 Tax=Formosa algae TaxID=225843 RepID=A0A9X0YIZ4_9FLAO|nr:GH25 family lysozyme [Formosa algae]MBP1839970.1 lysozyme [Formosa algae]MDQ0335569.1 lysozyme [Formosa algae]